MPKLKLTKGELKRQRDALRQFRRYLPTLQLKKQQLQTEIVHQLQLIKKKEKELDDKESSIKAWAGLLQETDIGQWIKSKEVPTSNRNIAGIDIPLFEKAEFADAEYDLFALPLWVDTAIEEIRSLVSIILNIETLKKGIEILRQELRVTTQRVNLFEKVKIPESLEAIRRIKIYLGDQQTNAVGRSKIAKKKIEALILAEVAA